MPSGGEAGEGAVSSRRSRSDGLLMGLATTIAALLTVPGTVMAQALPPTTVDPIVVEGARLRDLVEQFVDDVIEPPVRRGPARWARRVCVGAVNLRQDVAQALVDQVSEVARRVDLEVGEPGCRPNILIIGADDGAALARGLVERRPRLFRPGYSGASRSRLALEGFTTNPAPVRWWHVSLPVDRDTGAPAVRMRGEDPPMVAGRGRFRTNITNTLQRVVIVVDINAASGLNTVQLGDYLGVVALAQVDPEAETSAYDTILNLFEIEPRPSGMTDWDRAYLSALYEAELDQSGPPSQRREIVDRMLRDRARATGLEDAVPGLDD